MPKLPTDFASRTHSVARGPEGDFDAVLSGPRAIGDNNISTYVLKLRFTNHMWNLVPPQSRLSGPRL